MSTTPPRPRKYFREIDAPRISGTPPRGRPFAKGNGGRPKGARNKLTLMREALANGQAEVVLGLMRDGNVHAAIACGELVLAMTARDAAAAQYAQWQADSPEDAHALLLEAVDLMLGGQLAVEETERITRKLQRTAERLRGKRRNEVLAAIFGRIRSGLSTLAAPQPTVPRATDAAPPDAPPAPAR